jgi:hypothetical protein
MFPWQQLYRVAMQEVVNAPWFEQVVQSSPDVGRRLFTMEPIKNSSRFEIDIQPLGTTLYGDNTLIPEDTPTLDTVVSGPRVLKTWTPAKALVTYYLASGQTRSVRFDIGNGVTVGIPPTNKVDVDLLVWDDENIDEIPAPESSSVLREKVRFATTVSCKATCVPYSSSFPKARFTQVVFLPGGSADNAVQIPLEPQADAVQILASAVVGSASDLVIGDILALYQTNFTDLPQGVAPDALSAAMPTSVIDFDTAHVSRRVAVPHSHANVVRLAITDPEKASNVTISQEIY